MTFITGVRIRLRTVTRVKDDRGDDGKQEMDKCIQETMEVLMATRMVDRVVIQVRVIMILGHRFCKMKLPNGARKAQ